MGKRTSYEPGTFSWIELHTSDVEAAKSFYGRVFGWGRTTSRFPRRPAGARTRW